MLDILNKSLSVRLRRTVLGLGLGLLAPIAGAMPLSLNDALQAAYANNPDFLAAQQEAGVADGERLQAGLIPNPELSWEAEDTRRDTRTTTVTLSQAIELGGKRGARVEVAEYGQQLARITLEQRRNELRADVVLAYQMVRQAQVRLTLAEQSLALSERGLAVVNGQIKAGKSSPVEGTRAEVQLSAIEMELRRARIQKAEAQRILGRLTGMASAAVDASLDGLRTSGGPQNLGQLLDRIDQTAEMRLALLQIDQRQASLALEKTQRIPDLTVSLGSQYSQEDRERVNVVGLSMPLPLFNRNQGNVLAASRRADQALDLRNAALLRLRAQTETAFERWSSANQDIRTFDSQVLPAALKAVDNATRGFELGKFAFLEVLDTQRTLIASRTQYLQALTDSAEAQGELERLFGDFASFNPGQ